MQLKGPDMPKKGAINECNPGLVEFPAGKKVKLAPDHVVHRLWVFMASDEWGNELLHKLAAEYLAQHLDKPNLVVSVHEHGGWYLDFTHAKPGSNGPILVGTANDTATPSPERRRFWERVNGLPEVYVDSIRRETKPHQQPEANILFESGRFYVKKDGDNFRVWKVVTAAESDIMFPDLSLAILHCAQLDGKPMSAHKAVEIAKAIETRYDVAGAA
jgi:hypothetical protein